MARHEIQGPAGPSLRWHPSPSSVWVADYLSGTTSRPPRAVEDPLDWTLRGRRLQARAVGDGLIRLGRAFGRLFAGTWSRLARRYREHEAVRQLGRLDDHLLRDIGIRRSQIPLVVRGQIPAPGRARPCAEERQTEVDGPRDSGPERLAA